MHDEIIRLQSTLFGMDSAVSTSLTLLPLNIIRERRLSDTGFLFFF